MTEIKEFRTRACGLVQDLQASDEQFLEKVLELWSLGNKIYTEAWNTEFHIFGVIASDTDHLPLGKVREKCSAKYLRQADKEVKDAISFYAAELTKAYSEILNIYGGA